jgi:uncharacterized protein involved in type VI secretion and phage assembly
MDEFFGEPRPQAEPAYISGVVVGIVTNNQDPWGMGRVKVKLPHFGEADESNWARIAVPMAGQGRGIYFLPEVGDEVLVAFERANPRFPFILGALWNGKEQPPAKNDDGNNDVRIIKSRSGHVIRFTDNKEGGAKIEIIDNSGKNSLVFDTDANLIKIESAQDITLSAANGTIKLDARTIEIVSSDAAKVEASSRLDVKASGPMTLKGATIDLN